MNLYCISRVHTPMINNLVTRRWGHSGSPFYFNFINFASIDQDIKFFLIMLATRQSSSHFNSLEYIDLEGLKTPILHIPYLRFKSNNPSVIKLELVINQLCQFIKVFKIVDRNSVYYLDRNSILLAILLKFKNGFIVFRLLGITRRLYHGIDSGAVYYRFIKYCLNIRRSISIITQDGSWASMFVNKFGKSSRFHLLFNGVDKRSEFRKSLRHPGRISIVYMSRVVMGKGHHLFLRYLKMLVDSGFLLFKVDIVGGGDLLEDIKLISDKLQLAPYIRFHGELDHSDASNIVCKSDLCVSFNYFGCFGNNVLECSNNGIPILLLDINTYADLERVGLFYINDQEIERAVDFTIRLYNSPDFYKEYCKVSTVFAENYIPSWKQRIENEIRLIKDNFKGN